MDVVDYLRSTVNQQGVVCDVLRDTTTGSYGSDSTSKVDEVTVSIVADRTNQSLPESMDVDTSIYGLYAPQFDANGDLKHVVEVNDTLRVQQNTAKRYSVVAKDGLPNDIEPELWGLGLAHVNNQ